MGNLPKERVTQQRPFSISGVDFAGPVLLKLFSGRGSNRVQKSYIAVFVCTAVKAVHLELVTSLTSGSFIAAFRRFTSRRGHCKKLISDCGTNFIGASKELKKMFEQSMINLSPEIAELLAKDSTEWKFNPPGAPHMGGLWEATVKSVKFHLQRTLCETKLTYEEYVTLLYQIESCLNSRPLTTVNDNDELFALTPGHFLIGEPLITIPDETCNENVVYSYNNRWTYLQQKLQYFWRKWSQEYLTELQNRHKWMRSQTNIRVGNIVLIKDDRLPPSKWLLGRVVATHPGADGYVRVVSVKCKNTIVKRPIHKLCLLPIED
ncbi:uncharacterized protein LOC124534414 [Vanessa cardui]|uniref:uncharacterized protein LOC124534414 n=1 Tax=Vanessa cardui TaxID=171605 RepID=UPI001F13CE17|nr:uncharacterized protein LOC124534414 [Vanessa cardui]